VTKFMLTLRRFFSFPSTFFDTFDLEKGFFCTARTVTRLVGRNVG